MIGIMQQIEKMQDYVDTTSKDFGTGKENTNKMIKKWDEGAYGKKINVIYTKIYGKR